MNADVTPMNADCGLKIRQSLAIDDRGLPAAMTRRH